MERINVSKYIGFNCAKYKKKMIMNNYTPPYTISSKILDLTNKITQSMTELKYSSFQNITPMLRKANRIKILVGTLEIEGNFLGEEKITALLDGKRVLGTIPEITEVQGAIKAYQELENYQYDSLPDLLYAHKILMSDILNNAGSFRNINVRVGQHIAPQPFLVPQLMEELFSWLKNSDEHMLLKSCIFHYEFEFIHPFTDGNGRIGRLWQTLILSKWKPILAYLPVETVIRDKQTAYYEALLESDKAANSTIFVQFMLQSLLTAIKEVAPTNEQLLLFEYQNPLVSKLHKESPPQN